MKNYKYYAFISYKRDDEKWASWLQKKIESYRLPTYVYKENSSIPKKINVYRDVTDIKPGVLDNVLQDALDNSRRLIVICSVKSAHSYWVGKEIEHFLTTHGTEDITLFIVDGEPYSADEEKECYHQVIKDKLPEILGVNINEQGKDSRYIKRRKAVTRVVASMLRIDFDSLWQREKRRLRNVMIMRVALSLMVVAALAVIWTMNQPFDTEIALVQDTIQNENLTLPETGGMVTLKLGSQQTTDTIYKITDNVVFANIPAKYRREKAQLTVEIPGFEPLDTMMILSPQAQMKVQRDIKYFGKVVGVVRDARTDVFVPNAEVMVQNVKALTDAKGNFEIIVPLIEQHKEYKATVTVEGKVSQEQEAFPMQGNADIVNTLYTE